MYNQQNTIQSESVDSTWTSHDHSLFLNAVANGPDDIAGRWQELADAIPGKTADEVKAYYEAVERDLLEIEAGRVELPDYPDDEENGNANREEPVVRVMVKNEEEFVVKTDGEMMRNRTSKRVEKEERKKATPWSVEEHRRFLKGLEIYGKGDWRSISRNVVVTRTPTQVASHAQKYFLRQASLKEDNNNNNNNKQEENKKKKKRRCSIHDVTASSAPQPPLLSPSTPPPNIGSTFNGGQKLHATTWSPNKGAQSSSAPWPSITTTMLVNTQPISSTPPINNIFCGGQAPQPIYGGYGSVGALSHPPDNFYGGAAPWYEFMDPNLVKEYYQDHEELSFKNGHLN